MGLSLFGWMESIHQGLESAVMADPIAVSEPWIIPIEVQWGLSLVASILTSMFTLMSSGLLRRAFVLLMALISLVGFSMSCVLWNVLWLAHLELVSVVWAWVCSAVYAAQHKMPCDDVQVVLRKERVQLDVNI
ncbi:hypothetical protein [Rubritalea marina]|uniref:hypothetical protein n=1 Tax=Rubritalea marina TaxID=361055 RepID=UPI0003808D5E|nr:hypothetical protein [Rubritalea marina]